jgi:hypothetical protein
MKSASILPFLAQKIISLGDMETYQARRLVNISEWLASCRLATMAPTALPPEANAQIFSFLKKVASEAEAINLTQTAILARRILDEFDGQNISSMFDRINFLADLFGQESTSIHFFTVKDGRFRYYNNSQLAGEDFKANFPNGNGELLEAGNCLVTDRYTACVFHSMRALEIALIALERKLNITRPQEGPNKTWGRTLQRISEKLKENDKNPPANWERDKDFCEIFCTHLRTIQLICRDPTMHPESTYDESGAVEVFNMTAAALKCMAAKLSEKS